MADYKTVYENNEKADVRFTFRLDDYQIKKLKEYTDFPIGPSVGDIEVYINDEEICFFGGLKKIEIDKDVFEGIE